MTDIASEERNIYNVFLENKTFLEKFVGGGIVDLDLHVEDVEDETCECVDIITLSGHAFLLLQNQFYPEAANCVRKFNVASDETCCISQKFQYWQRWKMCMPMRILRVLLRLLLRAYS